MTLQKLHVSDGQIYDGLNINVASSVRHLSRFRLIRFPHAPHSLFYRQAELLTRSLFSSLRAAKQTSFQFRTATLPSIAGMQFSLLKCVETHEEMLPYTANQKSARYLMKSATCTFRAGMGEFCDSLDGPIASRFSSHFNTQLV